MDATAVASSGPIIHGIGVRSSTHSSAAARASSKVHTTRTVGWMDIFAAASAWQALALSISW